MHTVDAAEKSQDKGAIKMMERMSITFDWAAGKSYLDVAAVKLRPNDDEDSFTSSEEEEEEDKPP